MRRLMILASLLALLVHPFPARAAPDEELLGKSAGYPVGTPTRAKSDRFESGGIPQGLEF
jgi:hypothetical protein